MNNLPPGPRGPEFYNMIKWLSRPVPVMADGEARYGQMWTLRLPGSQTWVCVCPSDLINLVLKADPTLMHGGEANRPAIPLQGATSILVLDEEAHTQKRNMLRPSFRAERFARYEGVMEANCEEEVASWPLNTPFELLVAVERIALKNIIDVMFGVADPAKKELYLRRISELTVWGNKTLNLTLQRLSFDYRQRSTKSFARLLAPIDELIYGTIREAREDPNLENRDDVLAVVVQARNEDGSPISDLEVRDTMMTLFRQGHQTTATTIAWALERMMRYPNVFARLREELSSDGDAYLEAVINETLRVRTPLPLLVRKVNREPFQVGDYRLEPETKLALLLFQAHRRPDVYPEPERFRPERFLETPPSPDTWMPFGAGDRQCIGRTLAMHEIKSILRTIVQRTRLTPVEHIDEPITWRRTLLSPGKGAVAVMKERLPG